MFDFGGSVFATWVASGGPFSLSRDKEKGERNRAKGLRALGTRWARGL
jgi:hypothetical protein